MSGPKATTLSAAPLLSGVKARRSHGLRENLSVPPPNPLPLCPQLHQPFYQSLFALEYKPRCLQHLCRSAVRRRYGKDCHLLIPRLPIPRLLQRYLLLEPEGLIY
ncbi:hypothetical protein Z043_122631 [Scleropages formosus]|uniref:SOCS box domain-containing protein n=1 Tax=Scleropages formosus TaxID=113540 RepID=A0A0P7TZ96_SCLFO|nr:hypothetical protein Z043_122631 [Scleropages formosus]